MKIEFWSDIVCPYCGLMDNRLRLALERFEHADDVRVTHRSFQLHPDLPRAGITQRKLLETHGISAADGEGIFAPIEAAARAEGLDPYRALERTLGPTDLAHELLAHAADKGRGEETWTAMFRAHFGEGRRLWTEDEVLGFAAETGLDRADAARALRERRYRDRVAADQREAERLGAGGTPFTVLDGRYALRGAVSTDELLAAMTTVWEATHPEPAPLRVLGEGEGEGVCGPDGCAVLPHPLS
ncbi:protein disulfide-isomerase [Streptomyces camponoticapitis]|uniref:Protein disulfide-isomerase n=1 Tax=Streptomyces camponoticapitis TaxID=1616125 RepID=A0ABQ2DYX3_9ACTN|nr:DsbA family oxidoreductase [Streptomyces camponoticapitis]GGJ79288.1 protein disulfide-isomerase [Streptomyces camponoticapitis]